MYFKSDEYNIKDVALFIYGQCLNYYDYHMVSKEPKHSPLLC